MNKQNNLRRAMDKTLPGLEQDVWFEQRVMNRIHEQHRGRTVSKRTVALLLAAGLLLLSATAVAAVLLSGREVVDEFAVPMASDTPGDTYTVAQTLELVALAEENGIVLSENARDSIDKMLAVGEGYYKEELIMAIAKAEFGENPSAWTLEQQNWFDDVCVAIGFIPEKVKHIPNKGEDASAWAIAIADAYIREHYGDTSDLHDPEVYEQTGVQYINGDVDGEYPGMYYSVDYFPKNGAPAALTACEYWVYLNDAGEILGSSSHPGAVAGALPSQINSAYRSAYGDDEGDWSQEVLRAYREAIILAREDYDTKRTVLWFTLSSYPDIAPGAISKDEAAALAVEAIGNGQAVYQNAVYIGDEPNPVWKVRLYDTDPDQEDNIVGYAVEVDSITGEIKRIRTYDPYDGAGYFRNMVLEKDKEEADILFQEYVNTMPSNG
ncbi:MAG: hypothetical protein IJA77_05205 [Clostridia bacterium]|nr:hypothetical protein [Clostridia bacterium]